MTSKSKKQPRLAHCEFCGRKEKIEYCHIISRVKMGVLNRGRRPMQNGLYLCGHMRESGTCHNKLDLVLKTEIRKLFTGKEDEEIISWWDDPEDLRLTHVSKALEERLVKERLKSSLEWAKRLKKRNVLDKTPIETPSTLLISLDLGEFQKDQI